MKKGCVMNKSRSSYLVALVAVSCQCAFGFSEFRSPLMLQRGVLFYPQKAYDNGSWVVNTWDAVYSRSAGKAFISDKKSNKCPLSNCSSGGSCCGQSVAIVTNSPCPVGGTTRQASPLAALLFGKAAFRAEEAFYGGMLDSEQMAQSNPYVSFANIAPRLEYSEKGLYAGIEAHRKIGDGRTWRIGARASVPFKIIEVQRSPNCPLAETLQDVLNVGMPLICTANGAPYNPSNLQAFAYRLDFLSSLGIQSASSCGSGSNGVISYDSIISWGDGLSVCPESITGITRISCIDITNRDGKIPPVLAEYITTCCPPGVPPLSTVLSGTLGASGRVTDGGAALIDHGLYQFGFPWIGYAAGIGVDRQAQSKLWIVPNVTSQDQNARAAANAIHEAVQFILNTLDYQNKDSAEYFLAKKGISFNNSRTQGVGDLYTEFYTGYHPDEKKWYGDMIVGIKFPTGGKHADPADTLFVPTGNNGHAELSLGTEAGWQPRRWFAMRAYFAGTHVCTETEKRAVAFKGATIKNIGPAIDVDVNYNYVTSRFEFTFYHPYTSDIGCSVGYELYARGKDHVCCKSPSCPLDRAFCGCASPTTKLVGQKAYDLLGFLREIDCCLYACGTRTMTHKLTGDIFYRSCLGYLDLFGGGSCVIAGRYAMKETEGHIGVAVNF